METVCHATARVVTTRGDHVALSQVYAATTQEAVTRATTRVGGLKLGGRTTQAEVLIVVGAMEPVLAPVPHRVDTPVPHQVQGHTHQAQHRPTLQHQQDHTVAPTHRGMEVAKQVQG